MKLLKTLIVALIGVCLALPAYADLTVDEKEWVSLGNKKMLVSQVDFDSSYPFGGESFDYTAYGFNNVETVFFESQDGLTFEYDYTNKKIKAFAPAPPIVYEEKHTTTGTTTSYCTLKYPAAYIMNVASATANYSMLSADSTVGANEVLAELYETSPGTRAELYTSGAQTIYTTYVTQAWKDVFDNLVVDEAHAFTTTGTTLSYNAAAIMYMDNGSNTPLKPIASGDTAASGEVVVDWTPSSGANTTLTAQADASSGLVSYIKKPSSGFLADRWVEEEGSSITSGAASSTWPVLLHGTAGFLVDNHSTEQSPDDLMLAGDALGTSGEAYIDWFRTKTLMGNAINTQGTTSTRLSLTYIKGLPYEIPGLVPLEVPDTTDLSDVTNVRATIIGN